MLGATTLSVCTCNDLRWCLEELDDGSIAWVTEEGERLASRGPHERVDLVAIRLGMLLRARGDEEPGDDLSLLPDLVAARTKEREYEGLNAGLFCNLSHGRPHEGLARGTLAFWQRPVVVARPVDEQDVTVSADDDAAGCLNHRRCGARRRRR